VLNPSGNIAEFSSTNLFMAKDGVVHAPAINGTFLNGHPTTINHLASRFRNVDERARRSV